MTFSCDYVASFIPCSQKYLWLILLPFSLAGHSCRKTNAFNPKCRNLYTNHNRYNQPTFSVAIPLLERKHRHHTNQTFIAALYELLSFVIWVYWLHLNNTYDCKTMDNEGYVPHCSNSRISSWIFGGPSYSSKLECSSSWKSVCVCVCVCVWERERETERERKYFVSVTVSLFVVMCFFA